MQPDRIGVQAQGIGQLLRRGHALIDRRQDEGEQESTHSRTVRRWNTFHQDGQAATSSRRWTVPAGIESVQRCTGAYSA